TAVPGTYTVTYSVQDPVTLVTVTATRTVNVVDTTAPVITLNGNSTMTVQCGSTFTDPGATATDACAGNRTVTVSGSVNANAVGTYTLTYNANDGNGNNATPVTRTVNVVDTTAPVLTLNGSSVMTIQCGSTFTDPGATAVDACTGNRTVNMSGTVNTAVVGTYTRTYTANDGNGNTATTTRTVNVVDTTAPVITLNGSNPVSVQCGTSYTDAGATAVDACTGNRTVTTSGSVNTSVVGTYTITYSANDGNGNTATATRTVNVVDTTAPVITLNGSNPVSVQCGTSYTDAGATAVDACTGNRTVTTSGSVNTSVVGTYTITYSANDGNGNTATATRTVNVIDTTAPVITLNGSSPVSVQCGTSYTDAGATATDSCTGNRTVTTSGSVNTSVVGTYTITYSANDGNGNTATATRTVNVIDTTAPVITLNGNSTMTVQCGSTFTDPGATATDSCTGSRPVTVTGSVNTATPGTYTLTYNANDGNGNNATPVTRTVNVVDTTAPVITVNGSNPVTVQCGSSYTDAGATAVDACTGNRTVTTSGSVNTSVVGTYTITYSANDGNGNTATATRTVNVIDTTAPVITLNGNSTMTVQCGSTFTDPGATATDSCTGSRPVTVTGSVNTATPGTYTLTYNANDGNGNNATPVTRTVNVVDTTAPVLTVPGSNPIGIIVGQPFTPPTGTATDTCDSNVPVNVSGTVDNNTAGTYTLTYTATDDSNNTSIYVLTVIVSNNLPPVITILGDNPATVQCPNAYTDAGATATDAESGNLTSSITVTGLPINTSAPGTHTVTYSVTDPVTSQVVTATRTVNVVDTTAPVITLNGTSPVTVECGGSYTDAGATAVDACAGSIAVTPSGSVNVNVVGTYTITYTANDGNGNTATATRTVNVIDTTPPVITLNGDSVVTVQCGSTYTDAGATATDVCAGDRPVTVTGSVNANAVGTYTLTYTANDGNGNNATPVTRTVNVVDTQAPVITLNGNATETVECGGTYTDAGATAVDACAGSVAVTTSGSVNASQPGTYTLTYTANDGNGNNATPVTRTVNVVDTQAPVITLNGNATMTVECGGTYTDTGATAVDACDGVLTVSTNGTVNPAVPGTYTITYTATDGQSQTSVVTRTVNVVDTQAPVITLNGNVTVNVECGSTYTEAGATAVDTCDAFPTVNISGSVNTAVPGTYTLTYTATDASSNSASVTRTVNVADTQAPVITIPGANPVFILVGTPYTPPVATAVDACEGPVTVNVNGVVDVNTIGTYTVIYTAQDSGNRVATATLTVNVTADMPPVITILGDNPAVLDCGDTYTDAGALANDPEDGDVTANITVSGLPPAGPLAPGTWTVTYSVTDSYGNTTTANRTVDILDNCTLTVSAVGPTSLQVIQGQSATFEVAVNGEVGAVSLQWFKNDGSKAWVALPGATATTLTFDPVTMADAGTYQCEASDAVTTATSPIFTLSVDETGIPAAGGLGLAVLAALTALAGAKASRRRK
ncbi:MAG TPA: DUF5011 domain-containing protein, partial [Candidatus Hydrogenedentes bacterium]|nr:DUF5011 domain-containing protein [Candidatus Hydrogenedentota bacterium]